MFKYKLPNNSCGAFKLTKNPTVNLYQIPTKVFSNKCLPPIVKRDERTSKSPIEK
jgi:hypothetical protein